MFRYCNYIYGIKDPFNEFVLVARPKDSKKSGEVCKSDSGSGLFLKRGNRFVQIGMIFLKLKKKNIFYLLF